MSMTDASSPPTAGPTAEALEFEANVITSDKTTDLRVRTIRDLEMSSTTLLMIDTVTLLVDLFKLSMASLFSIFVPQLCPPSDNYRTYTPSSSATYWIGPAVGNYSVIPNACTDETYSHECSFVENFICLNALNQFVLAWNFITLAFCIIHYFVIWNREKFLSAHFQEDLNRGKIAFRSIIDDYPSLRQRFEILNKRVFHLSLFIAFLQVVNVISSFILIQFDYYENYTTETTFFANLLLIFLTFYNSMAAANIGIKYKVAFSCVGCKFNFYYLFRFLFSNVLFFCIFYLIRYVTHTYLSLFLLFSL
jgi:hypothetical protein